MLRKATSNILFQRALLARRRSKILCMATFAAVVVALLALGVTGGSTHAQSEPSDRWAGHQLGCHYARPAKRNG